MMLPSGNDAAIAIAEIIGLLAYLKSKNKPVDAYSDEWYKVAKHNNYAYIFINMMNEKCQRIGTTYTQIFNSHGNDAYEQLRNVSTCN
jgi:D-alanyl-D-alanine carboxypeptidase